MNRPLFSLLLLYAAASLSAQDTLSVELKQLRAAAQNKNFELLRSQAQVGEAEAELLKSRAAYLPNVEVSYTGTHTNNPLMAFGSKLNQERVQMEDFNPSKLNSPEGIFNFATKVEVQQPLFNKDALYQKKAGEIRVEALKDYSARSRQYVDLVVRNAYMQLQMSYAMEKVLRQAYFTVLANKAVVANYFKNGMVQKTELLEMEVRQSEIESQLKSAQAQVESASDYLFFVMGENPKGRILKPSEELSLDNKLIAPTTLPLERNDITSQQKALSSFDYMIKASQATLLPRINAFGSFELYDDKPYQFDANGYLVGVQVSWNVFDAKKSHAQSQILAAQKFSKSLELEQYLEKSSMELRKANRQIDESMARVELAEKALEQSEEAYRIRKNRYDQGLEKATDLLGAETMVSEKQLALVESTFHYNRAVAHLDFLLNEPITQ